MLPARAHSVRAVANVGSLLVAVAVGGCKDSIAPPAITVTAVTPATGSFAGGTNVTITGTNFIDVTSVTIGGDELGSRAVVSITEITGTAPATVNPGTADVVVTSSTHGRGICHGCFNYMSLGLQTQSLAAGWSYTCALTATGAGHCWGDNSFGQLGNGSTTGSSTPVAVSGSLSFVGVVTGYDHTCGLSGAAYCWGDNSSGQLGTGSTTSSLPPVAVSGSFSALATGNSHTCGLTHTGKAYCWGLNNMGQLGNGSRVSSPTPVAVSGGLSFMGLATGTLHTCGLTSAGVAYCWGDNTHGKLGGGTTTGPETCFIGGPGGGSFPCSTVPVHVETTLRLVSLSAGTAVGAHTCALTATGAGYCWGDNSSGQLGNGSTTNSAIPVPVSGGLSFSALAAGFHHTCGLTSGMAYCWGDNSSGQLGDGSTTNSAIPVPVSGGTLRFSTIATGGWHTCGLTSAGAGYCWGGNYSGQLGNGSTAASSIPVAVSGGLTFRP
jgi:alpha-tubulin suppressor-like RCC1 family protein